MAKFSLPTCTPQFATANCTACRLNKDSKLQLAGEGKRKLLVILEYQDAIQQATKTYMRGERYAYIRDVLAQYGLTPADYWITSAIQCYANEPTVARAVHCKPNIVSLIKTLQPSFVLGFGQATASAMLQDAIADGGGTDLDRVHGFVHPDRVLGCRMLFTYNPHPSTYTRNSIEDNIIRRDIHIAMREFSKPAVTYRDELECVRILTPSEAVSELTARIADKTERVVALDYETNALKPYNSDSKLLSCAISEDENDSFAFMLTDETIPLLRDYWRTPHITKVAHNSAFERVWTMVKLGVTPYKLLHDTMLLAHGLDNREGRWLSIKFLAPMLTGCAIWNKHIEMFLESTAAAKAQRGEYSLNRIHEIPVRQLLTYNAVDSLVELRVFHILIQYLREYYDTFPSDTSIQETQWSSYTTEMKM